MSKCSVCDNRGATRYHNEDMYHDECYYQCYEYGNYEHGYECAEQDLEEGHIDVALAVHAFKHDYPDTAFQFGYCRAIIDKHNGE